MTTRRVAAGVLDTCPRIITLVWRKAAESRSAINVDGYTSGAGIIPHLLSQGRAA